ncbi:hypothetical protein Tco_0800325 [Tanacetum coccineum]|uniref:Uncharacterized protein n=1 Tax=Tanacetum coccineum TaxID=301880 RepID=A0ABQ4ZWW1_9ASTR
MQGVGVIRVRMDMGDKEVTKQDLVAKVVMEVLGRLLGDMVVMSWRYGTFEEIGNVESTVDITELFKKLKFMCHWANSFKDFERSNVPRIKLSSFSESDDTFTSLQALSNLHYLFSSFMDYFWSRKLNISNFGPANSVCQFSMNVALCHGEIADITLVYPVWLLSCASYCSALEPEDHLSALKSVRELALSETIRNSERRSTELLKHIGVLAVVSTCESLTSLWTFPRLS